MMKIALSKRKRGVRQCKQLKQSINKIAQDELNYCTNYINTDYLRTLLELSTEVKHIIQIPLTSRHVANKINHTTSSLNLRRRALLEFQSYHDTFGIHPISGTLLGIIRENDILPHDYDLDFAIPSCPDKTIHKFIKSITKSKFINFHSLTYFSPLHSTYNSYIIDNNHSISKIKFIYSNTEEIPIDVFINYDYENKILHGSPYNTWINSNYSFEEVDFLDQSILIPEELYLTENYGDWKTQKKNYHYFLCPNYSPPVTALFLINVLNEYIKLTENNTITQEFNQSLSVILDQYQAKLSTLIKICRA